MVKLTSMLLVLLLALGAVACGGSDDDADEDQVATVENAETCEELVDAFMPIMQGVLDAVSDMSIAELMADEEPDVLDDFEEQLDAVEAKSDELDCQEDELNALLEERLDQLTATGPVGELILELIREEGFD
jgi:hypothetical protein